MSTEPMSQPSKSSQTTHDNQRNESTVSSPALHSSINFALICGGMSQRMGQDKAELTFDGETLIARICENVAPLIAHRYIDELLICSNNKTYSDIERHDPVYLSDALEDNQGPLSALSAALSYCSEQGNKWLVTMPCDTLLLPSDILPALSSAILSNTHYHLYYYVSQSQREHPLFAIYNTALAEPLADYLADGKRRVMDFVHGQKSAMITMPKAWPAYCNFNTMDAYESACHNYQQQLA